MASIGVASITVLPDMTKFVAATEAGVASSTKKLAKAGALAGAAIGTALAIEAKASITATQDLAKTTAGLSRNLGIATKEASRWGAVAKSRDIDTKSLNMAFTTLSRRFLDAKDGSESAVTAFQRLGVTQKELNATGGDFSKLVLTIAENFGEAEGGAKRQAAAQMLLGRGYQTLLPLFAEGSKGLKEQLHWADQYGATLSGPMLDAQMKQIMLQRELKVAWLGLQVQLGTFLTPALTKVTQQFQKFAEILNDKRLTQTEKLSKIGDIIERDWGAIRDFILEQIPRIANAVGEAAPKVAVAFVQGFLQADVWGKVAIGGFLLAKFGGFGAVSKLGTKMGTTLALGFIAAWEAKKVWDIISGEMLDAPATEQKVTDLIEAGWKNVKIPRPGVVTGTDPLGIYRVLKTQGDHWVDATKGQAKEVGKTQRALYDFHSELGARWRGDDKKTADNALKHFGRTIGGLRNVGGELNKTKGHAEDFRRGATDSFRETGDSARNLRDTVTAAESGIGEKTNKALKALGAKEVNFGIGAPSSKEVAALHRQRGGPIPGPSQGDRIPLMGEGGEYMVNSRAAARFRPLLDTINWKLAPRFAKGGEVMGRMVAEANRFEARHFPYLWGGGHGGFGIQPVDCSGAVSDILHAGGLLNAPMTSGSLMNWGKAGKGPLTVYASPTHTVMSLMGKFFGTSGSNPGGGAGWIEGGSAGLVPGGVARTMDAGSLISKIARVLITGPKGALRSVGQGAADKVWRAANAYIQRHTPSGVFGGGQFSAEGVLSPTQLASLWTNVNHALGDPNLMASIAMAESGGNPRAIGHDPGGTTGLGLWQITTGFNDALIAKYGGRNAMLTPIPNAQAAGALFRASGTAPWAASSGNWQKGGVVPFAGNFKGGGTVPGPRGAPRHAIVHGGEHIFEGSATPRGQAVSDAIIEIAKMIREQRKDVKREKHEARHLRQRERGASSPELRRALVDLLLNDMGTASELSTAQGGAGSSNRF